MGACNSTKQDIKKQKDKELDPPKSDRNEGEQEEVADFDKEAVGKDQKTSPVKSNKGHANAVNEEIKVLNIIYPKNDQFMDKQMITNSIKNCVILQDLDQKAKNEVISKMSLCKVERGQYIFKEGNIGFYFYIIQSGKAKLSIKGEYKKTLTKGECFGELALIHGGERTATIQAEDEIFLWCLERMNFKRIVDYVTAQHYEENKRFVESIPMLSKLF